MSQANIDVKVMDGASVKMRLFPDVALYTACQTGSTSKDAQWIGKSLWAFVGIKMCVANCLCGF